jgi:hypothetical protein
VPTLIITGREDLRTPVEDARRTAADYPNVRLLNVPDIGHSVLSSDLSGCAIRGLGTFLAGAPVANCPRRDRPLLDVAPFIPASIAALPRAPGVPGLAGRTLTAVAATVVDATRASARGALQGRRRVGGLRRGTVTLSGTTVTLRGYETIRGVQVSGTVTGRRATLTVSGPSAAPGTVTVTRARTTGTLGGVRISLRGSGPLG